MNYEQALEHLDGESKKSENAGSVVIQEFLGALKEKKEFRLENFKLLSPKNFAACMVLLQHEHERFEEDIFGKNLTVHKNAIVSNKKEMRGNIGTVDELIETLQKFSGASEVIFYNDPTSTPFEIENIGTLDVERLRDDKGYPRVKLGKSDHSIRMVVVELTSDI